MLLWIIGIFIQKKKNVFWTWTLWMVFKVKGSRMVLFMSYSFFFGMLIFIEWKVRAWCMFDVEYFPFTKIYDFFSFICRLETPMLENGVFTCFPKTVDLMSEKKFRIFCLHFEFLLIQNQWIFTKIIMKNYCHLQVKNKQWFRRCVGHRSGEKFPFHQTSNFKCKLKIK